MQDLIWAVGETPDWAGSAANRRDQFNQGNATAPVCNSRRRFKKSNPAGVVIVRRDMAKSS